MVNQTTQETFEANKAEATEYPSGLKVYFNKKGDGPQPTEGQTVFINYEGYLADGTLFDSNKREVLEKYEMLEGRRTPANGFKPMVTRYSMDVGLIAGFKEGMLKMKEGDVATLYIPSHLGYGEQGAGSGLIPPNADLIFKIEILPQAE